MPTNYMMPAVPQIWTPTQGDDYMQVMKYKSDMEAARLRNRISAEQMGKEEFEARQRKAVIDSYGGEQAFFNAQQQLVQAEEQKKAIAAGADMVKNYRKVLGTTKGLQDNWGKILPTLPKQFQGLNLDPANFTDDGYAVPVKDETGAVIGHHIFTEPGEKPTFHAVPKENTGIDAGLMRGKTEELRQEHPDWSPARLNFEAAKWANKEKEKTAQNKVVFGYEQKEKYEKTKEDRIRSNGFDGLSPQEKGLVFFDLAYTGKDPKLAWGDRQGYNDLLKQWSKWKLDNWGDYEGELEKAKRENPAWSPEQMEKVAMYRNSQKVEGRLAAMRTDYRAMDMSVKNQRKIYDMMNGFVLNLNKQVAEVKKLMDGSDPRIQKAQRAGLRLENIPIIQLKQRILGSGLEASVKSYLLEISNEIGKLSTGSAASIRELGENAQVKWEKIHDTNLPARELIKVLNTTQDQANMRIQSSREAMQFTRDELMKLGVNSNTEEKFGKDIKVDGKVKQFDITRNPGESIPDFLARAKKASSKAKGGK